MLTNFLNRAALRLGGNPSIQAAVLVAAEPEAGIELEVAKQDALVADVRPVFGLRLGPGQDRSLDDAKTALSRALADVLDGFDYDAKFESLIIEGTPDALDGFAIRSNLSDGAAKALEASQEFVLAAAHLVQRGKQLSSFRVRAKQRGVEITLNVPTGEILAKSQNIFQIASNGANVVDATAVANAYKAELRDTLSSFRFEPGATVEIDVTRTNNGQGMATTNLGGYAGKVVAAISPQRLDDLTRGPTAYARKGLSIRLTANAQGKITKFTRVVISDTLPVEAFANTNQALALAVAQDLSYEVAQNALRGALLPVLRAFEFPASSNVFIEVGPYPQRVDLLYANTNVTATVFNLFGPLQPILERLTRGPTPATRRKLSITAATDERGRVGDVVFALVRPETKLREERALLNFDPRQTKSTADISDTETKHLLRRKVFTALDGFTFPANADIVINVSPLGANKIVIAANVDDNVTPVLAAQDLFPEIERLTRGKNDLSRQTLRLRIRANAQGLVVLGPKALTQEN